MILCPHEHSKNVTEIFIKEICSVETEYVPIKQISFDHIPLNVVFYIVLV